LGVFSSFLILLCEEGFLMNLVISVLLGISFGMGLPVCMGYYTDTTPVEKRGKIAGLTLLASYMGSFAFFIITTYLGLIANVIILAIFRSLSLLIIPFINKSLEIATIGRMRIPKYLEIFRQRAFIFYFIPWLMFSLVNYLSLPVQLMILSENVGNILILIENVLIGVFAVIGGFLSDSFGRKRLAIVGFLLLGIGYGVLGISSTNLFSWYIYTVIDGVAWGILQATMLFVIWGDLAQGAFSERYYALGGLPYIFSSFLRITLGPYIAVTVPSYAIFSFVAFFLFLAVFPLTLAPETLPEKKLKERELKRYIEEAKRVREKFTKG
ncbi:MAG: MFS transporter, partial [Candidatus Jordarchaeaceae archaeon]